MLDIEVTFEWAEAASFGLDLRGTRVAYDPMSQTITCGKHQAPLPSQDGRVHLRVLVDRGSIEVFGQAGRAAISTGAMHPPDNHDCKLFARDGTATAVALTLHELDSVWKQRHTRTDRTIAPSCNTTPPHGRIARKNQRTLIFSGDA